MRIGFALPQHGDAARPDGILTIARRAEALGYQSLWVWERLLAPVQPKAPYPIGDGTHPEVFKSVLDPLETLTFVAGHTSRVTLGTSVLILPWYNPVLLGRRLSTLDVLSGGRLRVGFGVGWLPDESGRDPAALEMVVRANVKFAERPLGIDRSEYQGTLEQIAEDVAKTRRAGATEVFFDPWTAHPEVNSVGDWLTRMEQLWDVARAS